MIVRVNARVNGHSYGRSLGVIAEEDVFDRVKELILAWVG